jgi:hypothetical protein
MAAVWDRQPDETPKAYAAFRLYYEMPPGERSLAKVSAALGHASDSVVEKWSSHNGWRERVAAYDDYIANTALEIRVAGLTEFQQYVQQTETQHAAALDAIYGLVLRHKLEGVQNGEPIDLKDMQRLVSIAIDISSLKRRTAGLPTAYKTETVKEIETEQEVFFIGGKPEK